GEFEEAIIKENLISLVRVRDIDLSRLIPRNRLQFGRAYKVYDPSDSECFYPSIQGGIEILPCYVEYQGHILLILANNNNETVSALPDISFIAGQGAGVITSSNYSYAYVAPLPVGSRFITQQFVEVRDP